AGLLAQVAQALLAVPDVVAAGQDVDAGREQPARRVAGEAEAARGVLAVAHHQVEGVAALELGQKRLHHVAARRSDDVGDEEDVEHGPGPRGVTWRSPRPASRGSRSRGS